MLCGILKPLSVDIATMCTNAALRVSLRCVFLMSVVLLYPSFWQLSRRFSIRAVLVLFRTGEGGGRTGHPGTHSEGFRFKVHNVWLVGTKRHDSNIVLFFRNDVVFPKVSANWDD